jgi:hypothetical protein
MMDDIVSDPQPTPNTAELQLSEILPIYQIISEDNRNYNNIVWQFPTALVAANGVLIQALRDGPAFILLMISIINFGLLHALFKLGHNQHAIILALQRTEGIMKTIQGKKYQEMLPDFSKDRSRVLSKSSRGLINNLLLIANLIYFGIEFFRVISGT